MSITSIEKCVLDLYDIGVFQFGNFTLKSGIESPIYIDLRIIISYPRILENIAELMWSAKSSDTHDYICGVPYTALPIATLISTKQNLPMVLRRKESKNYGLKKMIEGKFEKRGECIIIEDVIVSGSSVYETVEELKKVSLNVSEAIIFVDREQGGKENLHDLGIKVSSVVTATEVLNILQKFNKIDEVLYKNSVNFIKTQRSPSIREVEQRSKINSGDSAHRLTMPISERANLKDLHPVAKKLLHIIQTKESNLCVAVDVRTSRELIHLADEIGPYICMLKTHINALLDFEWEVVEKLQQLSSMHDFLIFEDSKFGDIGNTVRSQFTEGVFQISKWADLVTVHGVPGKGAIEGLQVKDANCLGGVVVAEMSSEGALTDKAYMDGCLSLCKSYRSFLFGYVGQSSLSDDPTLIQMTPGISLKDSSDKLGQKYSSPEEAILQKGADVIIAGRGITRAENPKDAAQRYRTKGMEALRRRIENRQFAL